MFRILITQVVFVIYLSLVIVGGLSQAFANNVTIPNITTTPNQQGVEIPIMITNTVSLRGITVPLVLESVSGGASITSARIEFRDRLSGSLADIRLCNQYAHEDGTCKDGSPGGYGTITSTICGVESPVTEMPEGLLMHAGRIFSSDLFPGSDALGSIVLIIDIGPNDGLITVDTSCTDPANHIYFVKNDGFPVSDLTFSMGTITVGSGGSSCCGEFTGSFTGNTNCDSGGLRDLADITSLIDNVYVSKDALCCPENGNVNGDAEGLVNLADITGLIDHVYVSKTETTACE